MYRKGLKRKNSGGRIAQYVMLILQIQNGMIFLRKDNNHKHIRIWR